MRDADDEPLDASSLDATGAWRNLPESVKQKRWIANAANERSEAVLGPRIQRHLAAYAVALDAVDAAHRAIGDRTDFDLEADTRQAAVWVVAGRCIGGTRASMALLEAGFGAESATQIRAVHEATRLLGALADPAEGALLRRWLADDDNKWVRPGETRNAQERLRKRVKDGMFAARAEAEAAGDEDRVGKIDEGLAMEGMHEDASLTPASRHVYDVLSRIGHARRSGVRDAVSVELRQMVTGPHPDPALRAEYVEYGGMIVEELVMAVGDALGGFYGPSWYMTRMKPLLDAIGLIRREIPLTSGPFA